MAPDGTQASRSCSNGNEKRNHTQVEESNGLRQVSACHVQGTTRRPVWPEAKTEAPEEIRSKLEQDQSSQKPQCLAADQLSQIFWGRTWPQMCGHTSMPLKNIALVMSPGADGAHPASIICLASLAHLRRRLSLKVWCMCVAFL